MGIWCRAVDSSEWRSDEIDDAEFDVGFDAFIKQRKLPLFKKGEWPQERDQTPAVPIYEENDAKI